MMTAVRSILVLTVALVACRAQEQGVEAGEWTPLFDGVNMDVDTVFVDATVSLRLRWIATKFLNVVFDLGGGMRSAHHNDTMLDDHRMIEGGSHRSGILKLGVAAEFRLSDLIRISVFYSGGMAFGMLWGIDMYGPIYEDFETHQLGALLQFFIE